MVPPTMLVLDHRPVPNAPAFRPMETSALPPTTAELRSRLPELMLRDQHRLRRRIERLATLRGNGRREQELGKIAADMDAAVQRAEARRRSVPVIRYPAELPVSQRKD